MSNKRVASGRDMGGQRASGYGTSLNCSVAERPISGYGTGIRGGRRRGGSKMVKRHVYFV